MTAVEAIARTVPYRAMKPTLLVSAILLTAGFVAVQGQAPSSLDTAFQKFWDAKSPAEAARVVDGVIKSGVTYEDALQRLKKGRPFAAQKSGVVMLTNRTEDKVEH